MVWKLDAEREALLKHWQTVGNLGSVTQPLVQVNTKVITQASSKQDSPYVFSRTLGETKLSLRLSVSNYSQSR